MNDATDFIPASKDDWRKPSVNARKRKISTGIAPTSFHSTSTRTCASSISRDNSQSKSNSMQKVKDVLMEGRKLVKSHDLLQNSTSLKKNFEDFKRRTTYQEFGLQADAFQALDNLHEQEKEVGPSSCVSQDFAAGLKATRRLRQSSSPMWSMNPRVYAVEKAGGKRRYIVCHEGRFMHMYWRNCEPCARHHYEVIREGCPCRLYFDLEYGTAANPDISAEENENLMEEFIKELIYEIEHQFGIIISRKNIIDLDSSTPKKFSRHLIVHMPGGELFEDAISCGVFVKNFIGRLADEIATGRLQSKCFTLSKHLFINSKPIPSVSQGNNSVDDSENNVVGLHDSDGKVQTVDKESSSEISMAHRNRTCFVDLGVYTRNRLFRLFGSSKFGKPSSAALRIAERNQFPFPNDFGNDRFYIPAMGNSLLSQQTNMCKDTGDSDDTINDHLLIDELKKQFVWDDHARALEMTLVTISSKVAHNLDEKILNIPSLDRSSGFIDQSKPRMVIQGKVHNLSMSRRRTSSSYTNNIGPSPFSALENFINKNLANRKGVNGAVRAWTVESTSKDMTTIIYQIKGNRWCENIKRCHKSNNVMWNVSLADMKYWQTCHDPECRMMGFRGQVNVLPAEVQHLTKNILLEKNFEEDHEFDAAIATLDIPGVTSINDDSIIESEDEAFNNALVDAMESNPELYP